MKLNTKGRYAVTAVLDLALRKKEWPLTLLDISIKHNISLRYLEQIFAKLRLAGLVKSLKGPGGGYMVTKDLSQLSVKDVIDAVGEKVQMTKCGNHFKKYCIAKGVKCSTHDLWEGLSDKINGYLSSISIDDLMEKKHELHDIS